MQIIIIINVIVNIIYKLSINIIIYSLLNMELRLYNTNIKIIK